MKKVITILAVLVVSANIFAQAPNCLWANSAGGTNNEEGNSVCTDASGNVYMTGSFKSTTITFGTTTLTNADSSDIFIVKYASNGTVLWAKRAGGTESDEGNSVTTDASGNVYVTGYFSSPTITFGSTTLTNVGAGFNDFFIAKYDAAGTVLWAKSAGGDVYDYGQSVTTDASGNVYVTGTFTSPTIIFGTTTLSPTPSSGGIFIAKYDAAGTVLWAKSASGYGEEYGQSVATDASGNVYVTGAFQGSITFGTTILTNAGDIDIFIVKYDAAGTVLWAKRAGGTFNDSGNSVATDASGSLYVTGYYFGNTITFGTTTLTQTGNSMYGEDIFIVKYDAAGTVLWAKSADGGGNENGNSVSTDASGNVYITGYFESDTITFGTTALTNAGYGDIFIAKYDAAGDVLWAKSAGGTNYDSGNSVTTDVSGNVFVTGYFSSPTIALGTTIITNAGSSDIFIAKYSNPPHVNFGSDTAQCGGTVTLDAGNSGSSYLWSTGATTQTIIVSVSGNYSATVTNAFGSSSDTVAVTIDTSLPTASTISAGSATTFCAGNSVVLSGNVGGTWNTGASTSSITVSTSGTYSVTNTNSCGTATSNSISVTVNPLPTASTISAGGATTFCAGNSVTLSGNVGGTWSTGTSTSSITVLSAGTYSVNNTNSCGSTTSNSISVSINPLPIASTISAGGATTFCAGDFVILLGNVGGTWSTGASTSSITVLSAGTYSVTNTNSCGSTTSNAISTTVNPSTFLPDFVASQTNLIASPFNVTFFNTTPNTSTYAYKWWFGDGSSSQAVDPSHIFPFNGLYTVSLIAIDSITGCSDTTTKANYIVCTGATNPCTQTANISPIGTTNRCVGGSVLYTCTTNAANPTYQWNINGVPIGGATQSTYPATVNGVYTVTVYTNGTCPKTSASVTANFNNTAPTAPTISQTGAISGCSGGIINLNASNGFTSYLWSNGATAQNINITTSGNYYVIGTNSSNCTAQSNSLVINPSYLSAPEICLVTVDTVIDKNLIAWDKSGYIAAEVDSFIVMKEGIYAGVYNRIGAKSYNQLSEFTDVNSNALARADRYKIAVKDSCGNLTLPSGHYKTMHLQITPGNGLQRNLSWSHAEGIPYAFYYRINRWHQGVWATIDSVQSNLNTYTDLNVPDLNVDYIVEIKLSQPCTSSKSMQAARVSCTSNSSTNRTFLISPITVGISEVEQQLNFNIYPNPAKDLLNIEVNLKLNIKDLKLKILDVVGKLVMNETISNQHTELNIQYLNKGIYFVRVGNTVKKLVVD